MKSLTELGAEQILEEIKTQSATATEEANIHRAVTKMQNQWNSVKLETALNEQIGINLESCFHAHFVVEDSALVNAEEICNQCSLQLEDLDSLRSTRSVIMEEEVKEFGQKLNQVKEMVSTWIACQDSKLGFLKQVIYCKVRLDCIEACIERRRTD